MSNKTIVLKPDPTTPSIVGRDKAGMGWFYLDARKIMLRCSNCGGVIVYRGFVSADGRQKCCGGCVEVVS